MRRQNILQAFLFVAFFSIGTGALSGSVLYDDFLAYYRNRQLLSCSEESLDRLESLNADYDAVLWQLEKDPNFFIERMVPVMLGMEREDANTVYPSRTPEQLNAARKALSEDLNRHSSGPVMPGWLVRCRAPTQRTLLFVAGAFLVVISFMWFGSPEKTTTDKAPD